MAPMLHIDPQHPDRLHIERAADVLKSGGVIIYPTDTIYGLGCDITNAEAIERVQHIKGRDANKPMSFVCADLQDVDRYAQVSPYARNLLAQCLPGAYTFVLSATEDAPSILTTGQQTVGLRIPDHPVPRDLVLALGAPILSTSANFSTQEVITEPVDLQEQMGDLVDLIIECGSLPVQPSSVVSLVDDRAHVLRAGKGDLSPFGV
jgi:tRNA threonylcarbamoyl adenosine modification protein (Sua5/YciO/YrdC/YwlC family)